MGHINRSHLESARVVIPNQNLIEEFSNTLIPLVDLQIQLGIECKRLMNLRDTLLPKLLSGEIKLPINETVEH